MVDQDRLAAARQDEQSTVVTTEWAVLWPGDPAQGGGIEPRGDEQDARRVARMERGRRLRSCARPSPPCAARGGWRDRGRRVRHSGRAARGVVGGVVDAAGAGCRHGPRG